MPESILLTGSTGFLGKVVLQEILRQSKSLNLRSIYLPIRATSEENAFIRLKNEIFESPCLRDLKSFHEVSITPVWSDLDKPLLGISEKTLSMISQKITQTIHCAATVEFDSSLSNSVRTNVGGTLELFRLTKKFLHKPRFTFVSTAYVHTPASKQHFEERPVLLARPASEIYTEICKGNFSEKDLLQETGQANSYTLSKCLAEHLLILESRSENLKIVRPSIISACLKHPFPGWIDSGAAFAGFVAMLGTGKLRAVSARPNILLNVVPCDVVAKEILQISNRKEEDKDLIRQCVAARESSLSIKECRHSITKYFTRNQLSDPPDIRYVGPNGIAFQLADLLFHTIPLLCQSLVQYLGRDFAKAKQTRKMLKKIWLVNKEFSCFTHHEFDFSTALTAVKFARDSYLDLICAGVSEHIIKRSKLRRRSKTPESDQENN